MNLWIIYKEGIVILKFIAEMLQDCLENYINVSVGNAKKVNPSILFDETLDYLIIGDIISELNTGLEIHNWLLDFWKISQQNNLNIKKISGFYISPIDIHLEPLWVEFFQENINTEVIHPPILHIKLNGADFADFNRVFELVKEYSHDFIKFLLKE